MISTGANLYHDTHHAIGLSLHSGKPSWDDVQLRDEGVVRIYDIVFDYEVLLQTDLFYRKVLRLPEFDRPLSTAEFHYRVGRYVAGVEEKLNLTGSSLLAAAYRHAVPIFTSSPGDSSIGMNVAEQALAGSQLRFDVSADVNETASIVLEAKRTGGKSGVLIVGGGSPKNFMLQTEPQIQEVLGIDERGHDYFLQMTDARPDTGGLSGATPAEAVSWGKIDPEQLPGTVVVYGDNSIALPLLTAYARERKEPRPLKRLFGRRAAMMDRLVREYRAALEFRDQRAGESLSGLAPGAGGAETVGRR
jgi:deoxyhypusine synthase